MASPVNVQDLVLQNGCYLPSVSTNYWGCPSCEAVEYYENWETVNVYDYDSMVENINNALESNPLVVGDEERLVKLLRDAVQENGRERCPNCSEVFDEDDVLRVTRYECVECGETWDTGHDALTCCASTCYDLTCFCRQGLEYEIRPDKTFYPKEFFQRGKSTWFRCRCDRFGDNECGWHICIVCHRSLSPLEPSSAMEEHKCPGSPCPWEPVITVDGKPPSVPDCVCETDFCCQVHENHKRGHVMCSAVVSA